jgi:hypothetical protein
VSVDAKSGFRLTKPSESVDIYHVSPQHPRLAYVAFIDPSAGITAIETLHRRPISLDSPAVAQNPEDYDVWRDWNDTLTVVRAEPPALIPSSVVGDFADLPEWAQRGSSGNTATENNVEPHGDRKRERMSQTPAPAGSDPNSYVLTSSHSLLSPVRWPQWK